MSFHQNRSESNDSTVSFGRVFRQAPWRRHTQVLSGLAVVAALLVAIASMALAETSRAAAAGREVQQLRHAIQIIRYENALLRSKIASNASVVALEARARQLGLAPFTVDRIFHLEVRGLENSDRQAETPTDDTTTGIPMYDKTLQDWLNERIHRFMRREE